MKFTVSGHGVYYLKYHIVWVTKYRRRILNPGVEGYLHKILLKLLQSMPGVKIETIGFDEDHLHMVMEIPPKHSISSVMAQMKSQSASLLRKKFQYLSKVYWNENIIWSPGYFASSIGVNESIIRQYVEHQGSQDSGQQLELLFE